MDRRQLLKQSALAAAAFAFSRDAFSRSPHWPYGAGEAGVRRVVGARAPEGVR